ncbi:hypothetical protein ALO72_200117 [Pseudomonas syringae pv. delphinii]|nr:hypothetical protein ALO72_200117 [Pseudomonas syringae pv. delphinii]
MRDSTNALLREARMVSSEIESLNDIDAYLVDHQEADDHLVKSSESFKVSGTVEG